MNNYQKILKSSIPIILTYFLSYGIILLSILIYFCLGYSSIDKLINILPYILIITYLFYIIYFLKKYPISIKKKNKYFPYLLLGISLSVFLNMILFHVSHPTNSKTTIPLFLDIIASGIIGPIYEELLFRHIFYNKLKSFNSKKKSLYLTTIIFALIHLTTLKMIYALFLGFILTKVYQQKENILSPILIHVSANITSTFLFEYNTYLFFLSLISLILGSYLVFKK